MSHAPQMTPVADYVPSIFKTNTEVVTQASVTAAVSCSNVLLVGRTGSWSTVILKSLQRFGSELSFEAPDNVTPESVRAGKYDVVLLDSTVTPEQRRQLAAELLGSETSIFYTFPVENGCWWLPALRGGQDCHGAPAFRRNEFPFELERILRGQTQA